MFPIAVDQTRICEKRDDVPVDPWNWVLHSGFYFPKKTARQLEKDVFFRNLSREFGGSFKDADEFNSFAQNSLAYLDDNRCPDCGFHASSLTTLENHQSSRNCLNRQRKQQCMLEKKLYVPVGMQMVRCDICSQDFTNAYSYKTHLLSQKHRDQLDKRACIRIIPEVCTVCNFNSNKSGTKSEAKIKKAFIRHLRESRKCAKIAASTPEKRSEWRSLHKFFRCKFPPILKSNVLVV